jgi:hypothetical protein
LIVLRQLFDRPVSRLINLAHRLFGTIAATPTLSLSEASYGDAREENIMRTTAMIAVAVGFVSAIAIGTTAPVMAQGVYLNAPGVHIGVGSPGYQQQYREQPRYYDSSQGYGNGNGCRQGFTVQDGVCKPYRGY